MRERRIAIAVCGAHGSGKTTLIRAIEERVAELVDVRTISGLTRGIISRGFPLGKNASVDSYTNYIRDQLFTERKLKDRTSGFLISDRVILDAVAYSRVNERIPRPSVPSYFVEMLYEVWKLERERFDALIYVPVEFRMEIDSVRDVDEAYRLSVDQAVKELIEESELPFVAVTGSVQQRTDMALDFVSALPGSPLSGIHSSSINSRARVASSVSTPSIEADDPVFPYRDVAESPTVRRLADISFLGLMDYVYQLERPSNRFEHTLDVTRVALEMAHQLDLDEESRDVWAICNLLHDAGHSPFSHNSEPFLLETRRVYHTGLLSTSLRDGSKLLGWGTRSALAFRSEVVQRRVKDVLSRSGAEVLLEQLFYSPLNADKLDGNYRTARHLGVVPKTSAGEIVGAFRKEGDQISLRASALPSVHDFWSMEKHLYWDLIYTDAVFGAEAILTRALHLSYPTSSEVAEFIRSPEAAVMERLISRSTTSAYAHFITERKIPSKLREKATDVFNNYEQRFQDCRFDLQGRINLESEVASIIGVDSGRVISHFSRRKYFSGSLDVISQASLFDGNNDLVPLQEIDGALRRTKISGDLFEIYITPPL